MLVHFHLRSRRQNVCSANRSQKITLSWSMIGLVVQVLLEVKELDCWPFDTLSE